MRDDGEMDDLTGEQRNDTEKTVKSLLGLSDDFLMTSLSAQGETNQFISQGSTKRRAVLSRLLDLDVFDMIHDLASKEVSSLKSQLKNFPDRNWDDLNTKNFETSAILEKALSELNEKISENQSSIDLLKQDLSRHNTSIVQSSDVESHRRRVEDLRSKSQDCVRNIDTLKSEVESLQQKLVVVQKIVDDTDIDHLKKRLESHKKLEASIVELRHAHERENSILTSQRKSLKILDEVPCGDDYPSCKFIKDAHVNKQNIAHQEQQVQRALKTLEDACALLTVRQDDSVSEKISKYEKAHGLVDKLKLEISRKETEIERLRSTCDACYVSLVESEKKLKSLEEALDNEENEEVVTIRSKIKELSEETRKLDADKIEVASQMGKLNATMEQLTTEKTTRDQLLSTYRTQDLIASAFAKKGIPLLVTRSQLPVINAEVSKILQGIVDFVIELEIDDETDALEIYIDYGDSRRIVELCSGMEKTIAAIALRVAMVNVSSLPKSDFFVIDEGFGTLDSAGVEACSRFLTSLKRYFKTVIVITHVDGIKDAADHVLEITKSEKDSRLEYI
jgi:exonuclease SbcC